MIDDETDTTIQGIAIIGMAGRFPGATNIDEFWQNLRDGVESITFFSDQELEHAHIDPALFKQPNYVRARGVLKDCDLFAAAFFGYSPREAETMDPQHRVFLECAWEALEYAGYNPEQPQEKVGVYAGVSQSSYINNILTHPDVIAAVGNYQIMIGNDKDHLATRVSYKLNLRGPSTTIQTACSTSLVAVEQACYSLLTYQCDMALAGGVSIFLPQEAGYIYQEGGIASPDGHCRAFDASAKGTVSGNGVGIVVLKRLEDALAHGDTIHAVIKGWATNNDGASKVGYTTPSVQGQAEVIAMAHAVAAIEPETISYIETHGTGTPLGDPIEIAALKRVFCAETTQVGRCAIGSVKTNIGHLDVASGIAGLIKTVLALKYRMLPPSLHFHHWNPQIDHVQSPFYVNTELTAWPQGNHPRRAGVSSFGIGGTNAHTILEEAPSQESSKSSLSWHLLILSARTSSALEVATDNLHMYLKEHSEVELADIAYTLQLGRKTFQHRRIFVCRNHEDAVSIVETRDSNRLRTAFQETHQPSVTLLFPGQGSQYIQMASELYRTEAMFRDCVEYCSNVLERLEGFNLLAILYPTSEQEPAMAKLLIQTRIAQPALFVIEYALARLLMEYGIKPSAMVGHSIGEYVAACLADVMSLEDALLLVAARGRLMQSLPGGCMLAIEVSAEHIHTWLNDELWLAAINAPTQCVVAGSQPAIEKLSTLLAQQGITFRQLNVSHAFHSGMMEPVLQTFRELVGQISLSTPRLPYISNVTGTWITAAEATDPDYWVRHVRQTVRFSEGLQILLCSEEILLLEVGPGRTLSSLVQEHKKNDTVKNFAILRHPHDKSSESQFLLTILGELWLAGVSLDWRMLYAHEQRRRLPLPTYPFERHRYWIDFQRTNSDGKSLTLQPDKNVDMAKWFYFPSWKRSMPPTLINSRELEGGCYLVFVDAYGLGTDIVERLRQDHVDVICVKAGEQFLECGGGTYTVNPRQEDHYDALLAAINAYGKPLRAVIHCWTITVSMEDEQGAEKFELMQELGYYSLTFLAHAFIRAGLTSSVSTGESIHIKVITNHLFGVSYTDTIMPEKTTILGPCKIMPQEHANITCHCIEVAFPPAKTSQKTHLIELIVAEIQRDSPDRIVAYRHTQRWTQTFEPIYLQADSPHARPLRKQGVYLITGGLGGVGMMLADYLAETVQAKLVLLSRSSLPLREDWEHWLQTHDDDNRVNQIIWRIREMEKHGAQILLICADVADEESMQIAMNEIIQRFGTLHGVIHAAAVTKGKSIRCPVIETGVAEAEEQFIAKVYGTYVLARVLANKSLDFCLLFSSNAAILGGINFTAYAAANIFVDAFAAYQNAHSSLLWISSNWDGWQTQQEPVNSAAVAKFMMTPDECVEAFRRVVSMSTVDQIVISTGDLPTRLNIWVTLQHTQHPPVTEAFFSTTIENAGTELQELDDPVQKVIMNIWQTLLGIKNISIQENFFMLGGHSLLATRVVSWMKKSFPVEITLSDIFEKPSIAQLSELINIRLTNMITEMSEEEVLRLLANGMSIE